MWPIYFSRHSCKQDPWQEARVTVVLLNSTVFCCHDSRPTVYSRFSTAVEDSDWQTVRILLLRLDRSNPYWFANNIPIRKLINCTCKMIWLKKEVGCKNVSLFGKLSRFSWNYGGLCSNFVPNSLSIEGRHSYMLPYHHTKIRQEDQSSDLSGKAGSRGCKIWWASVSIIITHALHKHPPTLLWQVAGIRKPAIMMWRWSQWKGGAHLNFFAVSCSKFAY